MMESIAFFLLLTALIPAKVFAVELADYSYICFSHDAVFADKSSMIQTMKCVNTVGKEHLEYLTYSSDGIWSAILTSYGAQIQVFGQISDLNNAT